MVHLMSVKCPECGATLNIEQGRKQAFCAYCGANIFASNEGDSEKTFRYINEASVKREVSSYAIRMQELKMEEKRRKNRMILIIIWIVVTLALGALGIIGASAHNDGLHFCLLLALISGLGGLLTILTR